MKTGRIVLIVIAALVVILIFRGCSDYNKLVPMREKVNGDWANVENVYQRRADLIPNLVNTVKGYATHEQETFTKVTEARSKATSVTIDAANMTDEDLKRFQASQGEVSSALSRLLVVAEAYPDLKANQNFRDLQTDLVGSENRITVARRDFNESAKLYNSAINKFPTVMYAGFFGFKTRPYFAAEAGSQVAPKVQF
jgi:LemA protein